jgi:SAM-dependent methyltransferase
MKSTEQTASESIYYRDSDSIPFASRLSYRVRRKMFRLFMTSIRPRPDTRVLDVGVTSDERHKESNYFEQLYPYPHNITCVGTEDGSHLSERYPGVQYRQVKPTEPLPFADGEFDVVFSNAVVEHVGSRAGQGAFVGELCRVANAFFITTPNRWFPVEHHTGLPLVHYLPAPVFRFLIRDTRYRYWAKEVNLNILTARELADLFPQHVQLKIRSVHLFGIPSNLVAVGKRAT